MARQGMNPADMTVIRAIYKLRYNEFLDGDSFIEIILDPMRWRYYPSSNSDPRT